MRHPYVTLQADQDTLSRARATFRFSEAPSGHWASIDFGGLQITTGHDTTVNDLVATFERLASDLRLVTQQVRIKHWRESYPEQLAPLNTSGTCQSCGKVGVALFSHPSGAEVCPDCGMVEHLEELYLLAPDEHPLDKRMDQHDAGADAA